MQLHYFCILSLLSVSLTGCVYYGDIHGNAKPFTESSLTVPHTSIDSSTKHLHYPAVSSPWWARFKDPELNQLIEIALQDSPTLQMAENRVRRAEHLAEEIGASLWPSADFSSYLQRQKFSEFGLAPPPFNGKTFNIGEIGLNFNYEFDFWGKNRETLAEKISEKQAAEAELAESRLILSAAVANVYFQILSDAAEKEIAQENLQKSQEISKIVIDRASRGIESDIPVKTVLADTENARLKVIQYKQNELLARNQLAVLLGKNPFTIEMNYPAFIYYDYFIGLPNHLTMNILARRPDIFAMKLRAEAAAHQINVAKAGFYPDINLNALWSYQSIKLNHLFENQSHNNAITAAIDLPIFDAGARRANLGVQYAEYDLAINSYNATILTALQEVADQQTLLKTLYSQLQAQKAALKATQYNYKLFNLRYHHGIIDYVPVLELKQLLLQQQAVLVSLQTQHLKAEIAMIKALGGPLFTSRGVQS